MFHCPLPSRLRLAGKTLLIDPLSPRNSYCPLGCLIVCSEKSFWRCPVAGAGGVLWVGGNVQCTPFSSRARPAVVMPQGDCPNCTSLGLSLGVALDLGGKGSVLGALLFEDPTHVHGVVQYGQEHLLFGLAESWQAIQKDFLF